MSKKPALTYRIRKHYQTGENPDEWLYEKGKVKEARFLKEACERIEKLESALDQAVTMRHNKEDFFYRQERKELEEWKTKFKQLEAKHKELVYQWDRLKNYFQENFK